MTEGDALVGTILAERYRILRALGEGGMGRVYLAEHTRMGRMSAVKVMSPALTPTADAISRFNREAANASRINHPNVAAIYDFGETSDGTLYLAMEYVEGETLAALIARSGSLPATEVAELTRQIAAALNAAHHLGIVHRDLKPDNILVTRDAEGMRVVKVVDFGIAKTMQGGGQTVTSTGMSIGTPEYMSPEQLAGDKLDARTDIYSLGLVVFTMLTGEAAFAGQTSKQSLVQRLTTRPRPLESIRPSTTWPAKLQAALDRALSPEPDERYARVNDFALDVAAAVERVEPETARTRAMTPLGLPAIPEASRSKIVAAPSRTRSRAIPIALAAATVVAVGMGWSMMSGAPSADGPGPAVVQAVESVIPSPPPDTVAEPPRRAVDSTPIATATRRATSARAKDSIRAAPTDVAVAAVPETDLGPAPELGTGRHPWLRANGDSAAGGVPPINALQADAREVFGHISRTRKFIAAGQPAQALPELRLAAEEYFAFASTRPGARETAMMRQQLSSVTQVARATCRQSADSVARAVPRTAVCEGLARMAARIAQSGDGRPVPPGGRRNQRQPLRPQAR